MHGALGTLGLNPMWHSRAQHWGTKNVGIMQSAYDAMDTLDVPVPDGIDELRRAVAALGNADPEPAAPPGLAPGLNCPSANLLDLKGLARPEKFDGSDEHWLDWKEGFQSSMELLNLTPYLLAIDRMVEPIESC